MKTYEERRDAYVSAGNDFFPITNHEDGLDDGTECWYSVGSKKFSSRREAAEFLFSEFEAKSGEGESIKTKIIDSEIETPILISANTYADYFYVPATISVQVGEYKAVLQTGLSYCHNDYNCPSNNLEVYDDGSDLILFKLDQAYESIIDNDEFVAQLNEECGTSYKSTDLADMRNALIDVIINAQQLIKEAQAEAEAELESDENVYVICTEREEDDDTGEKRVCSEPELKIFDDQYEAQEYVDAINQTIDIARIIDKETARSQFPENF